jgi:hypothetical protein
MRLCIIAACVSEPDARQMPGLVTTRVDDLTAGLAELRAERCDCIVTPETIGEAASVSCLDVARVARGYGIACVIVTDHNCLDGPHGAACMLPGSSIIDAVQRAMTARGR